MRLNATLKRTCRGRAVARLLLLLGIVHFIGSASPGVFAAPILDPSINGILTLVTPSPAEQAKLNLIHELDFDSFGNLFGTLEIFGSNGSVVYIDKNTGLVTSLVSGISRPNQIALHSSGDFFVTSEVTPTSTTDRLFRVTPTYNGSNVPISASKVSVTTSLSIDTAEGLIVLQNNSAYGNVGDLLVGEDRDPGAILRVEPDAGPPATTTPLTTGLARPEGLALGDFGGASVAALYAAETTSDRVIKIESDGTVSTFGNPLGVSLNDPDGIEFGPDGFLYVTEDLSSPDGRILRIASDGTHSVVATGFSQAVGITFDPFNGDLYIAEQDFDRVWRITFVPEPSAIILFATTIACLLTYGWRRKRNLAR